MRPLTERIEQLDTSLFDLVASQTSDDDRASLLLLQACARSGGEYVYLEIGSHLGGTIQPHLADPLCKLIYSVDKRPPAQPDERGVDYLYCDNSTARMLATLSTAFPGGDIGKIVTFDCDASQMRTEQIKARPALFFIDGEHTNRAVLSDFAFCEKVAGTDSIVAFHDTNLIFTGVRRIKEDLDARKVPYQGYMLGGTVYAILLGEASARYGAKLKSHARSEGEYFRRARSELFRSRLRNRLMKYPSIYRLVKGVIDLFRGAG